MKTERGQQTDNPVWDPLCNLGERMFGSEGMIDSDVETAGLALNEPLLQQPVENSTGIPVILQIHRTDYTQLFDKTENLLFITLRHGSTNNK